MHDANAIRAIAAVLILILSGPALAWDDQSWQGWAFEVRGEGASVWVGAWESRLCEEFRRTVMAGPYQEAGIKSFRPCLPVAITEEPPGMEA